MKFAQDQGKQRIFIMPSGIIQIIAKVSYRQYFTGVYVYFGYCVKCDPHKEIVNSHFLH